MGHCLIILTAYTGESHSWLTKQTWSEISLNILRKFMTLCSAALLTLVGSMQPGAGLGLQVGLAWKKEKVQKNWVVILYGSSLHISDRGRHTNTSPLIFKWENVASKLITSREHCRTERMAHEGEWKIQNENSSFNSKYSKCSTSLHERKLLQREAS